MRILQFLTSARNEIGGPARAVIDLSAALSKRGHDVTLATINGADIPSSWRRFGASGPRVIQFARPELAGRLYLRTASGELGEIVRNSHAVHVHGVWEMVNIQLCYEAARHRVPYFISIRGMMDDWSMRQGRLKKRAYLALIGNRWLRGASKIHLTAQAELDQASPLIPKSSGRVIPNLLDLEPFARLPGPREALCAFPSTGGRLRLLFLSRLHRKKGLESFLRAIAILKNRGIAVLGLVAGSGEPTYVSAVKQTARSLDLTEEDCRFLGPVTGKLKLSLYQSADLFVLPTSQENFGFVFVEALACGLPVVTTTGVDIHPELQASGGALITDSNPEAIAGALAAILARRDDMRSMGARGREWVFRDLNPTRIVEQFESMYRLGSGS